MSNPSPFVARPRRGALPAVPKGETVATFASYLEAQTAVDKLAKADFPVTELFIVGTDLTSVEHITGKLSWGRVGLTGALSGAWIGVFLALLWTIASPNISWGVLVAAVLIGAGFGMVFSFASYALSRRNRDFTSSMQVLATSYAIIAAPNHVSRARQALGLSGENTHAHVTRATTSDLMSADSETIRTSDPKPVQRSGERPQYGELAETGEQPENK